MLSKSATMLLGLINQRPLNPYEITKQLQIMNVHRWYNIANSTVYATLKVLEKKEYICGNIEKGGNMPDKTVYSLTDKGKQEFVFPEKQIRYIAVAENEDTEKGLSDFVPFKNLFNDNLE